MTKREFLKIVGDWYNVNAKGESAADKPASIFDAGAMSPERWKTFTAATAR